MALQRKTRFGEHQKVHASQFTIDRTNLFVGRVEVHVTDEDLNGATSTYMSLGAGEDVASEAGIKGLAQGAQGGAVPLCVGVERRYDEQNSMAIYTYTFEGIATDHSVRFYDFELEFTMNQEPIETHPAFKDFNDKFGHYDPINRLWPQYITAAAAAAGLGGPSGSLGTSKLNPLYGVSSYFVPGVTYRLSFTDEDVDKNFMDGVGEVVSGSPPFLDDAFPNVTQALAGSGNRNWLKLAPKVRQRGSCLSVIEEYMLSGPRGWIGDIYSHEALNRKPDQ